MSRENYQSRLSSEKASYTDCFHVHSLPPIFHYWSDKYVRPKLEAFGFSNPDSAFTNYLSRHCSRAENRTSRFVSIGAGNCDLEIDVARNLRAQGYSDFSIECLDINPAMLARGAAAAQAADLSRNLDFTPCDLNEWQPAHPYDAVMASQSLHHVVQLETLFARLRDCLGPDGCFVISDIIGRNGHLRWPEALERVHEFWRKLPPSYRFNRKLERYEELYWNWDCSTEGFEGIRSQDILPLLLDTFQFELFVGFGNVIDPFVDRAFGPNFDPREAWDRSFIDAVQECDELGLTAGNLKPTHMIAVVGNRPAATPFAGNLSPAHSVRWPDHPRASQTTLAEGKTPYLWGNWPQSSQTELEIACTHLRESSELIEKLSRECKGGAAQIAELESMCEDRTAWARRLDGEMSDLALRFEKESAERDSRFKSEMEERTAWARHLDRELGTVIAQRREFETELEARTAWALRLQTELEERTAWAYRLDRQLQQKGSDMLEMDREIQNFRDSPWRLIRGLAGLFGRKLRRIFSRQL